MSNFYEDASVVMVPSGYKTSKVYSSVPDDGSADLTFSRSNDTATRVGPDGLIEKVRTNLLLQSNTYSNASWVKGTAGTGVSVTSGQSGYDGSSDAWLLAKNAAVEAMSQSISVSGVQTLSIYVKSGTLNWVRLGLGGGTFSSAYFDLSGSGALGSTSAVVTSKIESVANGWFRCSVVVNKSVNAIYIYPADGDGNTSGTSGNIYIQDAQLETGDVATDYIETTTSAVSVGPLANIPRLDYSGGANCPSLLLEPQRTNLALFSEQLDNTYWPKSSSISITANYSESPDGYQNADRIVSIGGAFPQIARAISGLTIGTAYTISFYVKSDGTTQLQQSFQVTGFSQTNFTPTSTWQRITYTFTATATSHTFVLFYNSGSAPAYSYLCWGIQWEAGSYATSYIPTLSAAVTRGADVASKTGISSLIGQTEGTLFCDIQWTVKPESGSPIVGLLTLNNATNLQNAILLGIERQSGGTNRFYSIVQVANVTTAALIGSSLTSGRYKAALAYKANDFALYVNGVQIATDTSGAVPTNSEVIVGARWVSDSVQVSDPISQALLFKTRLSNSDLETLTTL